MKNVVYAVAAVLLVLAFLPTDVLATLPNYAQGGNLESDLQTKGHSITNVLSLLVGIVSIIGILVGAVKIGGGNHDGGKTWVIGGVVALVIAGSVYGIASLVG